MYERNLLVGTLVFLALGLAAYIFAAFKINRSARDKAEREINLSVARGAVAMGTFCTWAHWICCHMHQMNPLVEATPESH